MINLNKLNEQKENDLSTINLFTDGSGKCGLAYLITDKNFHPLYHYSNVKKGEICQKYQQKGIEILCAKLGLEFIKDINLGKNIVIHHDYNGVNPETLKKNMISPSFEEHKFDPDYLNNYIKWIEDLEQMGYNITFNYVPSHQDISLYEPNILYTKEYLDWLDWERLSKVDITKLSGKDERKFKRLKKEYVDKELKNDFDIDEKYDKSTLEIAFNNYVDKKITSCDKRNICHNNSNDKAVNIDNKTDRKYIMDFIDYLILKTTNTND